MDDFKIKSLENESFGINNFYGKSMKRIYINDAEGESIEKSGFKILDFFSR